MHNYHGNVMSDEQKLRYKALNHKTAAANCLKKRECQIVVKKRNRIRQQKCRLLKTIPASPSKYQKVVHCVLRAAEKSPKKMMILQDTLASFKPVANQNMLNRTRVSVLQLQFVKKSNRMKEHADLVKQLIKEFGSIRKASLQFGVPYKTLHRLCQAPVLRKKETKQVWTDIKNFYTRNVVSHELPSARSKGRHFLSITLEECFLVYKEGCSREGKRNVSFSTFCCLRPKSVFTVGQTPDRQCICEQCENFRLVKNQLIKFGVKAVPAHTTDCVKLSLCQIDSFDSENDRIDSFHLINPDYGKVQCITRNCQNCGIEKIQLKVLEGNPNLQQDENIIQWNRWVWVEKFPGSTAKKMILRTEQGTHKDLLDVFLDDLKSLSHHLFSANWNYAQFQYIRDNLKPGYLLSVLDFGQNYINVFQDEPQSIHWDHTQMTIHPIVNFFIKPGESVVTVEEHIMISNDKNHDKYAVKTFEEASLNYLKEKGFTPTHIIQFNDNCASQYKGKFTFQFVSCSEIPLLKMYFGAQHGKGPADGAVGRVTFAATRAVKAGQVIIRSAQEFYSFCVEKLNKNTSGTFVQKFFYIDNIDRTQTIEAVTTKTSSTWFSVRSCGAPYVIESREIGCICESCILSDGTACPNQAYCPPWKAINMRTGKPLLDENFRNMHWPVPPDRINSFPDRNNRSSNRNDSFHNSVDNFVGSLDETSDWDLVMDVLKNFGGILTWKLTLTRYQKMSCATSRPASRNTTGNVTLWMMLL